MPEYPRVVRTCHVQDPYPLLLVILHVLDRSLDHKGHVAQILHASHRLQCEDEAEDTDCTDSIQTAFQGQLMQAYSLLSCALGPATITAHMLLLICCCLCLLFLTVNLLSLTR